MTMRLTGSSAALQFHRYSNLRSSSGAGRSPSRTFPGAPSGTETTFLIPACSSASLSISPSTMTISLAPAMSSSPNMIFSAPLICQNDLSEPRYLMLTSSPSRVYGNTSALTCSPAAGEKTRCAATPLRSATSREIPREMSQSAHCFALSVSAPGPTRSRDSGAGSLGAPPGPDPARRLIPVPTLAPDPEPNTADDLSPFASTFRPDPAPNDGRASAVDAPPVHSHVARWHIH
mmetsp:Transcript_12049/g.51892  ORF Transcript_12049/g.51892 Transcript_12049/m.51892 type:complete len:233 (-) Transcript_12049:505-1203(-)